MKRSLWKTAAGLLLLFGCAPALLALRAGDKAVDPKSVYLSGRPLHLVPYTVNPANRDKLKVLVIFNVWSDASRDAVPGLALLAEKYAGMVSFAMLGADERTDVAQFLRDFPKLKIPVSVDAGKTVATYMGGSMLFPKAFVVDYEGWILWDGEVVDLGEMLDSFYRGTFDRARQIPVSKQLDALQIALRSGDEVAGAKAAEAIFQLDPGNSAALRFRLFMLESTKRANDAWALLSRLAAKAPKEKKIRFFQLDLALRYAALADKLPGVLDKLEESGASEGEKLTMYWRLLNERPFDAALLGRVHARLFGGASRPTAPTPEETRLFCALSALVVYRTGDAAQAVDYQKKALAVPGLPDNEQLADMLKFYETAGKLRATDY